MITKAQTTGKTLEEAIEKALSQLQTTKENVNIKVLEEPTKGIFGLGGKEAIIVATVKGSEDDLPEAPKPVKEAVQEVKPKPAKKANTAEKPTAATVIKTETASAGTDMLYNFLSELVFKIEKTCVVNVTDEGEHLKAVITGEGIGAIIGRRGETLDAIQYLASLVVNKGKHGDDYRRVVVDTENYRAKREETLIRLANSMASKVVKYKKDLSLEPMNPYERRIIHSCLQGRTDITTKSVGQEPNRKIVVCYAKNR